MRWRRRRGGALTLRSSRRCVRSFMRWARRRRRRTRSAAAAASYCGRRLVAGAAVAGPGAVLRGAAARALRRRLRRCRCSTPTTRCGSARCWARRATRDSALARQLSYWRERLKGLPEQLELPARPGASCGGELSRRRRSRCRCRLRCTAGCWSWRGESRASLFMVLQAGLAALLSRLGAGPDIAIGSPIAGRTDEALDDLVGFFVNTLVLRTDTSGQPSFRELWRGCVRPTWRPTAIRMCRLSGWSNCSTRRGRCRVTRCSR